MPIKITTKFCISRKLNVCQITTFILCTGFGFLFLIPIEDNLLLTGVVKSKILPTLLFRWNCREDIDWKTYRVEDLTLDQIVNYLEWTNGTSCQLSHDFGGVVINSVGLDGQKAICLDSQVRPERANSEVWPVLTSNGIDECLVYSFGINNEWSFDEAMEAFGCRVYAFDPSMNVSDHNHSAKIHFFNVGLSDRDKYDWKEKDSTNMNKWTMKSLHSIYHSLLRHEGKIIDYLKIDIEHGEWIVLPQIISSGMMDKVRQLGVEIHLISPSKKDRLNDLRARVSILKSLEDYGLVRFDSKLNPWSKDLKVVDNTSWFGYNSYEIVWYNWKLLRQRE